MIVARKQMRSPPDHLFSRSGRSLRTRCVGYSTNCRLAWGKANRPSVSGHPPVLLLEAWYLPLLPARLRVLHADEDVHALAFHLLPAAFLLYKPALYASFLPCV